MPRVKYCLLLFVLLWGRLTAGDETRSSRVYANKLVPGAFIETYDDKFPGTSGYTNYTNRCVVELGLDEDKHLGSVTKKVYVKFDLVVTNSSGSSSTIYLDRELEINYSSGQLTRYRDKAQMVFPNAYKVRVYNIRMYTCALAAANSVCTVPFKDPDVYIQVGITTTRLYNFNFTSSLGSGDISHQLKTTEQEMEIQWNYLPGAEEYELEYTYIDDYTSSSVTSQMSAGVLNYDLEHNSTRIVTTNNSYRIPLVYERGYIIYRIRPIGRSAVNDRMEGTWAGAPATGIVSNTPYAQLIPTLNNDALNWGSSKSFAEYGKTGTGIVFTDGVGKERQVLARLNTDQKTAAQSSLYDFYGRSVVNLLPSPVTGLDLNYRFGLNKYKATPTSVVIEFNKSIFDQVLNTNMCSVNGFSIDAGSSIGASNYFSDNNTNKQGYQGYVPNADGFPYSQMKLKPDLLLRPTTITIPGKTHQLTSGKELKYFYAKPTQVELDRLFGSEAPKAINCYKNYFIDANGQTSTEYLDEKGRTMATALLSNGPLSLDDLPNIPTTQLFTDNLSANPNNHKDTANKCLEVNTTFFVNQNETQDYLYSVTLAEFADPNCMPANICFDCVYDLEIHIKDECNQEFFDYDLTASPAKDYKGTIGGTGVPYLTGTCNGPVTMQITGAALGSYITINFPHPGTYSLYKRLCVSEAPIEDYVSAFIANQTCIDPCYYVDSVLASPDFGKGCGPKTCLDCQGSISGNSTSYMNQYVNNSSYTSQFDPETGLPLDPNYSGPIYPNPTPQKLSEWYEGCAAICGPVTVCEKYEKTLMSDFFPGSGQYASYTPSDVNSIMYANNTLFGGADFQQPPSAYLNAAGSQDYVKIGSSNVLPENLTAAQYSQYYRKSWAKSFLPKHPEYCKLRFYCDVISNSLQYDEDMQAIHHYDTVCTNVGMIYPLTNTLPGNVIAVPAAACTAISLDPLFVTYTNSHPIYGTLIANFKTELLTNLNNSGKSIYDYVAAQFYTTLPGGYKFGQDECNRDAMWMMFTSIYRTKKENLYKAMYAAYSVNAPQGSNCTAAVPANYVTHFPDLDREFNGMDTTYPQAGTLPSSTALQNLLTNPQPSDLTALQTNVLAAYAATMTAGCAATCASYRTMWNMNLNTACPNYSSANPLLQAQILNALEGVCQKGCDMNNQAGASTTAPGQGYTIPAYSTFGSAVAYSFQDVLTHFGMSCSSALISQPLPYPYNNTGSGPTSKNTLTTCKCDQILELSQAYAADKLGNTLPPGVTEEWQYFRHFKGYDLKEYYALKCLCNGAIAQDAGHGWVSGSWTQPQIDELDKYPLPVNLKLNCESCVKCSDVTTSINGLSLPNGGYPDVVTAILQDSVNTYFALAALNTQFGTHSIKFYIDLYNDCQTFNTNGTFINTITDESLDLYYYLNQLVEEKNMQKTNRPLSICKDSKFFLSGLFKGNLLGPYTGYTYNYTAGNPLTFTIKDPAQNTILAVSLTLPLGATWANLTSLENFVAWCPTPVAGANYGFKVDALDNLFNSYTISGQITNAAFPICKLSSGAGPVPMVCPKKTKKKNTCAISAINNALTQGKILYANKLQGLVANFIGAYKIHCFESVSEVFTRQYTFGKEHSYTLYYYDEAGNTVRTVPPLGVVPLSITSAISTVQYPTHSSGLNGVSKQYVAETKYNSYNAPVMVSTVDGGVSKFLYDNLGRLLASQDSRQAALVGGNFYSYTLYDQYGRIVEVGEMSTPVNLFTNPNINSISNTAFKNILQAGTTVKKHIIKSYYDELPASLSVYATAYFGVTTNKTNNLRNRVSCTYYIDDPSQNSGDYDNAFFYSYDDQGNVDFVVNEDNSLPLQLKGTSPNYGSQFKKVSYEYDLLSGNVIRTTYQPGKTDQFIHKYFYDDDNRLHEVYTSRDDMNWDRDAKYFYYEHGPLARIERADKQVQGSDYYYTIHNWVKGVNSDQQKKESDPGKDGALGNIYQTNYANIHAWFAKDAMSFGLNYYNVGSNKDYEAIKSSNFNTSNDLNPNASFSNLYNSSTSASFFLDNGSGLGDGPSLYNGNISSIVTSFLDKDPLNTIADYTPFPQLTGYRYDQLHRIKSMKAHRSINNNIWASATGSNYDGSYLMNLTYDDNGNILSLTRNGAHNALKPGSMLNMDNLSYKYAKLNVTGNINSNKLYAITDQVPVANYGDDFDAPAATPAYANGSNYYNYDEMGNLKSDKNEYIQSIEWTVDKKVRKISRDAAAMLLTGTGVNSITKSDIEYIYNSMRQRVGKIVKPRDVATKQLTPWYQWMYTYYVYNAGGNVMAVYNRKVTSLGAGKYEDKLTLAENYIYGSNRLALSRPAGGSSVSQTYTFSLCGGEIPCDFILPPPDGSGDPGGAPNGRGYSGSQANAAGGGGQNPPVPTATDPAGTVNYARLLGFKEFELNNHLGNVIATVSDRKVEIWGNDTINCTFSNAPSRDGFDPWNSSVVSGELYYGTTQQYSGMGRVFPTTPGKKYRIRYRLTQNLSGVSLEGEVYPYPVQPPFLVNVPTAVGQNELIFTATASKAWFRVQMASITQPYSVSWRIDDVIIDELMDYGPDMLMHTDYYPFGQQMPARTWVASDYRYGMNGQEKEDALFVGANSAEFWMYDSRIGRRWEIDPLTYEWQSPYSTFNNNPIFFSDPLGLEGDPPVGGDGKKGGGDDKKGGAETKKGGAVCQTCEGNAQQQEYLKNNPNYKSDGKGGVVLGDGGAPKSTGKTPSTAPKKPESAPKPKSESTPKPKSKKNDAPLISIRYGNPSGSYGYFQTSIAQIYGNQNIKYYNTPFNNASGHFAPDEPDVFFQLQGRLKGKLEWSFLLVKQKIDPFPGGLKLEAPTGLEGGLGYRTNLFQPGKKFRFTLDLSATIGPTIAYPYMNNGGTIAPYHGLGGKKTGSYTIAGIGGTAVARVDANFVHGVVLFMAVNYHHVTGKQFTTSGGGQGINNLGSVEAVFGIGYNIGSK